MKKIKAFCILFLIIITSVQAQEQYYTDIFGAHIYKNGTYEEKTWDDIFGNKQFQNSNGETASLSKDIFDNLIYKDSRGNEVELSKEIWSEMLIRMKGNIDILFAELREQNFQRSNNKSSVKIDLLGHEIISENDLTEEFWVDILDVQQYKNSRGVTASLKIDLFDNLIYTDSKGNSLTISGNNRVGKHNHQRKSSRAVLKRLVNQFLFNSFDWLF